MIEVDNYEMLLNLPSTPKVGEYAKVDKYLYQFTDNQEWEKVKNDITTNLYDLNATAIIQLPNHTIKEFKEDRKIIDDFATKNYQSKYFALTCKELYNGSFYNTLFYRTYKKDRNTLGQEVIDCLTDVGDIKLISDETDHVECWINFKDNMMCFMFYPCDAAVIEVE